MQKVVWGVQVMSLMLEGEGRAGSGGGMNARGLSDAPHLLPPAAQALHLICCCEDFGHEEEVEVRTSKRFNVGCVTWVDLLGKANFSTV